MKILMLRLSFITLTTVVLRVLRHASLKSCICSSLLCMYSTANSYAALECSKNGIRVRKEVLIHYVTTAWTHIHWQATCVLWHIHWQATCVLWHIHWQATCVHVYAAKALSDWLRRCRVTVGDLRGKTFLKLLKMLVDSVLLYGAEVWGSCGHQLRGYSWELQGYFWE